MKKAIPWIAGIVGIILVVAGLSNRSYAMNSVSSPTYDQQLGTGSSYMRVNCRDVGDNSIWYMDYNFPLGSSGSFSVASKVSGSCVFLGQMSKIIGTNIYQYIYSDKNTTNDLQHSILFNKSGVYSSGITTASFISTDGQKIAYPSGSNLEVYTLDTSTMGMSHTDTINMSARFGHTISIATGVKPVYEIQSTTGNGTFWIYQGSDGNLYKIDGNFTVDLPVSTGIINNARPLGNIPGGVNYFVSSTISNSGSQYIQSQANTWNIQNLQKLPSIYTTLRDMSEYENPKVYFNEGTVSYDLNCATQGYDTCTLSSGKYKCSDGSGNISPNGEICGGTYTPTPDYGSGTCNDGIQNQDEIGIDYGGVCNNIKSTGCFAKQYNILSLNKYDFLSLTGSTDSLTGSTNISFDNYTSDSMNEDFFALYNTKTGSTISTTSLQSNSGGTMSIIKPDNNGNSTQAEIFTIRSGIYKKINYIRLHTTYQGITVLGSQMSNYVADVIFKNSNGSVTVPMIWSGGYATAITSSYADKELDINQFTSTIPFDGFEIGYSSESVTKTNCGNQYYSCSFVQSGPYNLSCQSSLNPSGTSQGGCAIVGTNCMPTSNTGAYYDGFTSSGSSLVAITNSSGQTVGIALGADGADGVFVCNIRDGLDAIGDSIKCPFTIIGNVWGKIKSYVSSTLGLVNNVSNIGAGSFSGGIIPADSTQSGYTNSISGSVNPIVKSLFSTADTFNSTDSGLGRIVKESKWAMYFLGFIFIIITIVVAWAWKNSRG